MQDVTGSSERRAVREHDVGHRGWIGLRLDVDLDWVEVEGSVVETYRHVAPKKLAALLDD